MLLVAAALVGCGSSIFHPESSRVARMASGGRHGLAQSLFQVGGNTGQALGPLLAAVIVLPHGQASIAWFCARGAARASVLLYRSAVWYKARTARARRGRRRRASASPSCSPASRVGTIGILLALIFSKYFYIAEPRRAITPSI